MGTSCIVRNTTPASSRFVISGPIRAVSTVCDKAGGFLACTEGSKILSAIFLSSLRVCNSPLDPGIRRSGGKLLSAVGPEDDCPRTGELTRALYTSCTSRCNAGISITHLTRAFNNKISCGSGQIFTCFTESIVRNGSVMLQAPNGAYHGCYDIISTIRTVLLLLTGKGSKGTCGVTSPRACYSVGRFTGTFVGYSKESLGLVRSLDLSDDRCPTRLGVLLSATGVGSLNFGPADGLASLMRSLLE